MITASLLAEPPTKCFKENNKKVATLETLPIDTSFPTPLHRHSNFCFFVVFLKKKSYKSFDHA